MLNPLPNESLDRAFFQARTVNGYTDKEVTDEDLRALYDLMKWGPTSTNQQPLRIVWCRTPESKHAWRRFAIPAMRRRCWQRRSLPFWA
ncbi:MAG TPA: nitroreductase family protein [Steroidobacter sp.]|uniref:nitroreductase family protein n=1 Tax=Steroidobacter sp. TaxID=1978227 RepID=UPI002EDBAD30